MKCKRLIEHDTIQIRFYRITLQSHILRFSAADGRSNTGERHESVRATSSPGLYDGLSPGLRHFERRRCENLCQWLWCLR